MGLLLCNFKSLESIFNKMPNDNFIISNTVMLIEIFLLKVWNRHNLHTFNIQAMQGHTRKSVSHFIQS